MLREWFRAPSRLQLAFLAVMLSFSATLGWLGWRLVRQEEQLSEQRLAERRETAADLAVAVLEQRLSRIEQDLNRGIPQTSEVMEGAVYVQFLSGTVRAWPQDRLLYYPDQTPPRKAELSSFRDSDELEFRKLDYPAAITALRELERSSDASTRAAAVVRLGRIYLKNGQPEESLRAYESLAGAGAIPVGGVPAALAAHVGVLSVLERQKDQPRLVTAARTLERDLHSGRWPVTFGAYSYLAEQAGRWGAVPQPGQRAALAEGAEWLWEKWQQHGDGNSDGRVSLETAAGSVLLLWRISGATLTGFIARNDAVEQQWLKENMPRGVRVALASSNGHRLSDDSDHKRRSAIRLSTATRLPWTVQVFDALDTQQRQSLGERGNLLLAGMCVLFGLILTGSWFVGRAVTRELAVARLQSDFVSAVSHEFRTPLTVLCQFSESLKLGRVIREQDRQQYYELLHKESERLRRLVEGLLDFGRLASGKMQYRRVKLDAAALVKEAAVEFAQEVGVPPHRFEVSTGEHSASVLADREALRCVLHNLLDNAVKYSPPDSTVWVTVENHEPHVDILVRDNGAGIPRAEQRRIFERFVRGSTAREGKVRGTGVGLATARQIVQAHAGEITVESEPGQGSTFRVRLPRVEDE